MVEVAAFAASRLVSTNAYEHVERSFYQIGGEFWQPTIVATRPTVLDGDVLSFDKAIFRETSTESSQQVIRIIRRTPT